MGSGGIGSSFGNQTAESEQESDVDSPEHDTGSESEAETEDNRTVTIMQTCEKMVGSGPCYHPYNLVAEGLSRTYITDEGENKQIITGVGEDSFTMKSIGSEGEEMESTWTCNPDGISGYTADAFIAEMLGGIASGYWSVDIEGTMLPAEISAGDTWQMTVIITVGVEQSGVDSKNVIVLTIDYMAAVEEIVSVPAGTFNARRIDFETKGENTLEVVVDGGGSMSQHLASIEASGSDWYAECIGKVKGNNKSTVTGIADSQHETSMELTSFNQP